jgi:ATP-dependent Clp protease ATP-binding subunit ClpX
LPIVTTLEPLDRDTLIEVLTEPKNAIVKQYQEMFSMDNVSLEFTQGALEAAANRALGHQTGARCLRYIVEETLLDVMYELPSLENVARCIVDWDAIKGIGSPKLITNDGKTIALPCPPMQKLA